MNGFSLLKKVKKTAEVKFCMQAPHNKMNKFIIINFPGSKLKLNDIKLNT